MDSNKVDFKQVIFFSGAFIAFLIGSGFATGQEIMQYFVAYGFMGIVGAIVVFLLFLYVGISFITTGYERKFPKPNDIYTYYCGKTIGKFFDYFSILFIYLSFIVMIGGAGATLNQQYDLPVLIGSIGLAVLAGVTVMFGLIKIIDVIGKVGPVICVMAILLGISAIIMNPSGLGKAAQIIPNLDLLSASSNWIFAAGSYVGFCMLWLAAFMSTMGATAVNKKTASFGAIFGALGFSAGVIVMALGLMVNVEQVEGSLVPTLILAGNIHPGIAVIFALTVVAGIYTTSVPLLWTVSSRIADEKSSKFKSATIILAIIGTFVALNIPFDRLVNIVYVINGYVGILLLALMIIKSIRNVVGGKKNENNRDGGSLETNVR
ncbi:YkvI family membrane protein [Oceanobacillus salinisoli]|uniref:YkvI family membrane protein n=1 Tax=Oceanobacillus salinisoli TaxID=2678611 RepID=UPI0012E1E0FB|nr:hypothetical protein [Oceanobacillus salinisoli]